MAEEKDRPKPKPGALKQRDLSKEPSSGSTTEPNRRPKGVSSVFEFETPDGANAEMKTELKEELDPRALRNEGILKYLNLRRFKVPGVSEAVAFAFVSNKTAERFGLESAVANHLV